MNRTMDVRLDERSRRFVEGEIEAGAYRSASEVVQAGLALLRDRKALARALDDALVQGEASGPPEPFDFDDFLQSKRAEAPRT